MEINKNIKLFLNWVIGPLLFAWIAWKISVDLRAHSDTLINPKLWFTRLRYHILFLLGIQFALMALQWSIEAFKWKILLSSSLQIPFRVAVGAIFRGIAVSVVTPNRVGEFVGRVLHLPQTHVMQGVGWTFVSNLAQLIVTLCMGIFSVLLLHDELNGIFKNTQWYWLNDMTAVIAFSALFIVASIFWGTPWVLKQTAKWSSQFSSRLHTMAETPRRKLAIILGLSFLRFSVFVFQYWVFFWAMEISIGYVDLLLKLSVLFLWLAIIPTFTILELGLRWQFALILFSDWNEFQLPILFIITCIWSINFILPAILGALDLIRYRPFKIKT